MRFKELVVICTILFVNGCSTNAPQLRFKLQRNQNPLMMEKDLSVKLQMFSGISKTYYTNPNSTEQQIEDSPLGEFGAIKRERDGVSTRLQLNLKVLDSIELIARESGGGIKLKIPTPDFFDQHNIVHALFVTYDYASYQEDEDELHHDFGPELKSAFRRKHNSIDYAYSIGKQFDSFIIYTGIFKNDTDISGYDYIERTEIDHDLSMSYDGTVFGLEYDITPNFSIGYEYQNINFITESESTNNSFKFSYLFN